MESAAERWIGRIAVAVLLAGAVAWVAARVEPLRGSIPIALTLVNIAILLRPLSRRLGTIEIRRRETPELGDLGGPLLTIFAGLVVFVWGMLPRKLGSMWTGDVTFGITVAIAIAVAIAGARNARALARVVGKRRWSGGPATDVVVIGRVAQSHGPALLVRGKVTLVGSQVAATTLATTTGAQFEDAEFSAGHHFQVEAGAGSVEVVAAEVRWFTTESAITSRSKSGSDKTYNYTVSVPGDAEVAIAGDVVDHHGTLRVSNGLLLGTAHGKDPLERARQCRSYWLGTWIGVGATCVAYGALLGAAASGALARVHF